MLYIYHHLGLGDHIVCNGLVNQLREDLEGDLTLLVKTAFHQSVKSLYKPEDIKLQPVKGDAEAVQFLTKGEKKCLQIGFSQCDIFNWERSFYNQLDLDYNLRFTKFKVYRNKKTEDYLVNSLQLPTQYALVNSACSLKKIILPAQTNLPIINVEQLSDNFFDWIPLILKASEIHTIDTAFFQLVKNLPFSGKKFFYDMNEPHIGKSLSRTTFEDKNWNIFRLK